VTVMDLLKLSNTPTQILRNREHNAGAALFDELCQADRTAPCRRAPAPNAARASCADVLLSCPGGRAGSGICSRGPPILRRHSYVSNLLILFRLQMAQCWLKWASTETGPSS